MIYILFLISSLTFGEATLLQVGVYQEMNKCFEVREEVIEAIGRPIVGYQAVCVIVEDESVM